MFGLSRRYSPSPASLEFYLSAGMGERYMPAAKACVAAHTAGKSPPSPVIWFWKVDAEIATDNYRATNYRLQLGWRTIP